MFKKVFYNTASQVVAKVITASSTLFITLIIGKSLGPTGYGDFTKIFTFVGYFYTLGDFGLNAQFIKRTQNENAQNLLKVLIGTRLVLGLLLAAAAVFISFVLPYNQQTQVGFSPLVKAGIAIASLTIITQAVFTSQNAFFQKNLRYDLSAICAVGGTILILLVTLIASLSKGGLLSYAWAYVLGGITFTLIAFIFLKRFKFNPIPIFDLVSSLKLIKQSAPIGLALIFNLIYFRIDIFILSTTRSSQEVGVYGLAYQFFEAALSLPIFIVNALYPQLLDLYAKDRKAYNSRAKNSLYLLIISSVGLMIFLLATSLFIPAFYDSRFTGSRNALQILSLGMPFFFVSALLWHILIIKNRQKLLAPIYLVGAIFNIALNILLIPKYGFMAAATVTIISEALITLLLTIALRGLPNDHPWPKI